MVSEMEILRSGVLLFVFDFIVRVLIFLSCCLLVRPVILTKIPFVRII